MGPSGAELPNVFFRKMMRDAEEAAIVQFLDDFFYKSPPIEKYLKNQCFISLVLIYSGQPGELPVFTQELIGAAAKIHAGIEILWHEPSEEDCFKNR